MNKIAEQLRELAEALIERRPQLLAAWHRRVDEDPELTTVSSISRAQFYDHIPQVLDAFGHQLCAKDFADQNDATAEQKKSAAEHGLHRWQQGYNQLQTMREWAHLQLCVLDELERYATDYPAVEASTLHIARRALARLCGDGVCESADRYARLQKLEAASRMRELELAVQQAQEVDRERAARWREAAHDLRSTVNVVTTAAAVLDRDGVAEAARERMLQVLRRGTTSLHELLADLLDLARLEAGQERRKLSRFDAAQVLKEFCEPLRALAAERKLFFHTDGIETLLVEGDAVKVQRIAQNLVTNALKATSRGGVRVSWEERNVGDRQHWILCVQDTGPGLNLAIAAPLARVLKRATEESQHVEELADALGAREQKLDPAPTLASRSSPEPPSELGGEGIGLSIVKRLCELLDASLELTTAAGEGTTFRVIFPRQYSLTDTKS